MPKYVTYVPGIKCNLCVRKLIRVLFNRASNAKPIDSGLEVTLSPMNDLYIPALIAQGVAAFWWAIPPAILWFIVDTSWFKGKLGEFVVARSFKNYLDPETYTVLHDVTLQLIDDTTQIDHVVVSPFGVFVVETKNMSGWIFGSEKNRHWTQMVYRNKFGFQNPIRQNYKHLKAVADITGLPQTKLHSVVIFTGSAKFKTTMPDNVTRRARGALYIRNQREVLLSDAEIDAALATLRDRSLKRGTRTNRSHIQSLKRQCRQPICPRCGSAMVKRTTRKGPNTGKQFWGCSALPECRATRPLDR